MNTDNTALINIIDVGSTGYLPEPWTFNYALVGKLLRFEPRERATQSEDVISLAEMLWERAEERNFFIYRGYNGSGSSLLLQNYDYVLKNFETLKKRGPDELARTWLERSLPVAVERVACRSLDSILRELNPSIRFHFLKIDAQGAEYHILRGAEHFLQNDCLGLQLELFEIPLYKDITLLEGVRAYLSGFGFELVKKYPPHGTFDSQHDCVFFKKNAQSAEMAAIRRVYEIPAPDSLSDAAKPGMAGVSPVRSGNDCFAKHDYAQAAEHYRQALASGLDNTVRTDVLVALGKCCVELSRTEVPATAPRPGDRCA